ncbi:MAG: proteasome accessory factor PafA2 family protein [Verrucomicrobiales bacterium]|nr:proteasome accessory factor PafA2 family protein [Verrucomicrobiales bacterium]
MSTPTFRMGSETEFGICFGWSRQRAEAIQTQVEALPHLRSAKGTGVFLANGARCYVDNGRHNEYATPECHEPAELVTHELAGRRLLQSCAQATPEHHTLLCSNVDPRTGLTWGTHENYECPRPLTSRELGVLSLHLITRILYTGAGGLDPTEPGIRILLSPRAQFLQRCTAVQGMMARSIIYNKGQNHGPGHRLHVIAGESLLSHEANYLKYATTRLVSCLLSQGILLGPSPLGPTALTALRRINRDLSLSTLLTLPCGRRFTALDIQEALWTDTARHVAQLPPWGTLALRRWRDMLDALRANHPSLPRRLDWMLFRDAAFAVCEHHGLDPDHLAEWNARARSPEPRPARGNATASSGVPHGCETVSRRSRTEETRARVAHVRQALGELYIRVHTLDQDSLFDTLAGGAPAAHRLPEITDARVEHAMTQPPSGRAANRSRWVRLHAHEASLRVSWEMVVDVPREHRMELDERMLPPNQDPWAMGPAALVGPLANGDSLFRRGRYAEFAQGVAATPPEVIADWDAGFLESVCLALGRLGRLEECEAFLEHFRRRVGPFPHASITLSSRVHLGLVPAVESLSAIVEQARALGNPQREDPYYLLILEVYHARLRMLQSQDAEPRTRLADDLRTLVSHPEMNQRPRMLSRTRCYLAEVHRIAGDFAEARVQLSIALRTYRQAGLDGDLAFHGLATLAKLAEEPEAALALDEAIAILRRNQSHQRLAHLLLLRARRLGRSPDLEEIRRWTDSVPALRACPVARRILAEWDTWWQPSGDWSSRDYWGL